MNRLLVALRNFGVGLVILVLFLVIRAKMTPLVPFEAGLWKGYDNFPSQENPRTSMLRDLEANHLKPGMTRAQVVALLGPPSDTLDRVANGGYYLTYSLGGYKRSFGYSYYQVYFDASGRYTHSKVQHD